MHEHDPNPGQKRPTYFINEAGAIEEEIGIHDEEMTDEEIAAEEALSSECPYE